MFRKGEAPAVPKTVSRCDSCGDLQRRPFRAGDYVYAESACGRCGGVSVITGIYGERAG